MNTFIDLENALKSELHTWAKRQALQPYEDFYLYYLPTTEEHDGGILICKDRPSNPGYQLAMAERIVKEMSIEENFRRLHSVLRRLPVLRIKKEAD